MKVYVAGSLRNVHGLDVVFTAVRDAGYEITLDYRKSDATPEALFGPNHRSLAPAEHIAALARPAARAKFALDKDAIERADVLVLVKSCGESAIWEAGHASGIGRKVVVLLDKKPASGELMQSFATAFVTSIPELLDTLSTYAAIITGAASATTLEHVAKIVWLVLGLRAHYIPPNELHRAVGAFTCAMCGAAYETATPTAAVIVGHGVVPVDVAARSFHPICPVCIETSEDFAYDVVQMLRHDAGHAGHHDHRGQHGAA